MKSNFLFFLRGREKKYEIKSGAGSKIYKATSISQSQRRTFYTLSSLDVEKVKFIWLN